MIDEPFDPWQAVAERDDVVVSLHPIARLMGGGFYARAGRLGVIVVDPDLSGDQRRAVLTHELIHHERGGAPEGCGGEAGCFVDDDERSVEREVAHRLVPADVLDRFVRAARRGGLGIGPAEVADHFEVPPEVAALALHELRRRPARRRPR